MADQRRKTVAERPNQARDTSVGPTEQSERPGPDQDRIARRAYERYQGRGGEHGRDWEDWFEAERDEQGETRG